MNLTEENIKYISNNLLNDRYANNFQATKELIELFDKITNGTKQKLHTPDDYTKMYYESFYTFSTWKELVESEKKQGNGYTEEECKKQLGETIWQLPCGWYIQYV